jgi:hypothetical protein
MTMRKLDLLWRRHMDFKYPKQDTTGGKANKKGHGSSGRKSIDEIPFL